jgi:L-alanine-DL-glutamate epimerase-like enolase superfamily enzyme
MRKLTIATESWPIAGTFTIARGSKTEAAVVVVTIEDGEFRGRGECVPYARYGETQGSVVEAIEAQHNAIAGGLGREDLLTWMPPGAARNALDCALWDLDAKLHRRPAWQIAQLRQPPSPVVTCYTLSVGTPDEMRAAAEKVSHRSLLKVKLSGDGDAARIAAVRKGAPKARLVVDANEAWREDIFDDNMRACAEAGVELIEQPLPAGKDDALTRLSRLIPICADESVHGLASLSQLDGRYDAINIKLDKTGGLTEALALAKEARARHLKVMVGCMVATSLSMAPALLVAQDADWVDLDGPLLLARDRPDGLSYDGSLVAPSAPVLWG